MRLKRLPNKHLITGLCSPLDNCAITFRACCTPTFFAVDLFPALAKFSVFTTGALAGCSLMQPLNKIACCAGSPPPPPLPTTP